MRENDAVGQGKAGIWIDHRRALVVMLSGDQERTIQVPSKVEKHSVRTGDSPLKGRYEPQQVPADNRRQRALTQELNAYYDRVIEALTNIGHLAIFGPGEAKLEFKKQLEKHNLALQIAVIEIADKISDRQFVAKVRGFFKEAGASAEA